jgi:4a-hydroxytetrahydrobiopterin dehydratase
MVTDAGLPDWRKLQQALHARFLIESYADGARFVAAVGEACSTGAVVPELRLGPTYVDAISKDEAVARQVSAIAVEHGLIAQPGAVAELEVALDAGDRAAIGPFWAAVLTGSTDSFDEIDVCDPTGRVPNFWFQRTDPHETPRQRFHIDLWLPPEIVPSRIKAAIAAGGTVVSDDEAPAFTVLADPEGNKVCLCTSEGR